MKFAPRTPGPPSGDPQGRRANRRRPGAPPGPPLRSAVQDPWLPGPVAGPRRVQRQLCGASPAPSVGSARLLYFHPGAPGVYFVASRSSPRRLWEAPKHLACCPLSAECAPECAGFPIYISRAASFFPRAKECFLFSRAGGPCLQSPPPPGRGRTDQTTVAAATASFHQPGRRGLL